MDIPQIGFGTYKIAPADAYDAVSEALRIGYRHIDTAEMYGNEAEVGQAIADSGIDRDEIFITSKLDNPFHEPQAAREAFAKSLEDLKTDHVDLFLIHWPLANSAGFVDTWRTLTEFAEDGRARQIGTSNFQIPHLERIIAEVGVTPAVNQVELHPHLQQRDLVAFHDAHAIRTESWSPLARGHMLTDDLILTIADELGRTPAQVVIRWHIEKGYVVIPKSVHPERIASNFDVFGFELGPDLVARIDTLDCDGRVGSHPDKVEI